MRNNLWLLTIFIALTTLTQSCKKDKRSTSDCSSDLLTTRKLTDNLASVKLTSGRFYIIEQAAIDTKLNPCNLPKEFQVDNLQVTISGDVKATVRIGVCCIENFIISKITT